MAELLHPDPSQLIVRDTRGEGDDMRVRSCALVQVGCGDPAAVHCCDLDLEVLPEVRSRNADDKESPGHHWAAVDETAVVGVRGGRGRGQRLAHGQPRAEEWPPVPDEPALVDLRRVNCPPPGAPGRSVVGGGRTGLRAGACLRVAAEFLGTAGDVPRGQP
jgi:hypothetical protein